MHDDMYAKLPSLVFGFHGCDRSIFDRVVRDGGELNNSENDYDWLGHGIYFWEQNIERAWEWANELRKRGKLENPAVIGAVIDLGYCLNLLDSRYINILKNHFIYFRELMTFLNKPMPENKNIGGNSDLLLRNLDCAVIQHLHVTASIENELEFDSVRGLFREGEPIYPSAGFYEKTHIQICIRNKNCIKGYFSPRDVIDDEFAIL